MRWRWTAKGLAAWAFDGERGGGRLWRGSLAMVGLEWEE